MTDEFKIAAQPYSSSVYSIELTLAEIEKILLHERFIGERRTSDFYSKYNRDDIQIVLRNAGRNETDIWAKGANPNDTDDMLDQIITTCTTSTEDNIRT